MVDDGIGKEELAVIIRDSIHNLDLNDKESEEIFNGYMYRFLAKLEGCYLEAYDDKVGAANKANLVSNILGANKKIKGNITIGIGFNMDATGARVEWEESGVRLSFDDVRIGKIKITVEDAKKLYIQSTKTRTDEVEKLYQDIWDQLRPNEKLAILSPYFPDYACMPE